MPGVPDVAKPAASYFVILISVLFGALAIVFIGWYPRGGLGITVTQPQPANGEATGTFRLHHRLYGYQSEGIGGACLIGDFARLLDPKDATSKGVVDRVCNNYRDCNPKGWPAGPTEAQNWEGYCVPDQRGQPQGKCWYKPWDSDPDKVGGKTDREMERRLCNKSPFYPSTTPAGTPWLVGQDHPVPLDNGFVFHEFYKKYTNGSPARWRVSGRLYPRTITTPPTWVDAFSDPVCIPDGNKSC